MDEIVQAGIGVFTGIVTLAIISVIISRKSQTPQVINAFSSALANVVAAAVNPINTATTNGNLGLNSFSTPQSVNSSTSLNKFPAIPAP